MFVFQFDESTNYLYRTVHIHITKEQLDELKKSKDPIFIDGLISKILAQTEFGTVQLVKEYTVDLAQTIWSHVPSLWSIPNDSDFIFNSLPRSRPILINFAVVILTYLLCRRFHINYFVVVFFGFAYCLYEYLDAECHNVSQFWFVYLSPINRCHLNKHRRIIFCYLQRIEINETVDLLYGNEKNPCLSPSKMNWYDWMIGRDSKSACRDFLAYVHKIWFLFHFSICLEIYFKNWFCLFWTVNNAHIKINAVSSIYFMNSSQRS